MAADLAAVLGLPGGVVRVLVGVAAALLAATVVRGTALVLRPVPDARERWRSLATWWTLLTLLVVLVVLGRPAVVVGTAALSLLLLREALPLVGAGGSFLAVAAAAVAVYLWAGLDWRGLLLRVVPAALAGAAMAEILWRTALRPRFGVARRVVAVFLLAVIGPAYVVAVASAAPGSLPSPSPLGWLVVLLLLTELNDIAQAWWGRALGRRRLAPVLSPHKTWEGLVGGLAVTVLAAILLVPMATGYAGLAGSAAGGPPGPPWLWSGCVGLVVGLAGTAGDLSASALKRSAGVKDSGTLLPGQGGVLDRFDSLTLTAPAFFALIYLLAAARP